MYSPSHYRLLRQLSGAIVLVFLCISQSVGQIKITGSASVLAKTDQLNHLQVYVSASIPEAIDITGAVGGKLYSYTTTANNATEVTSATLNPDGRTWHLSSPKTDTGYFVRKEGEIVDYYWLINYADYPLPKGVLAAEKPEENYCTDVRLRWVETVRPMQYRTPSGVPEILLRKFRISFENLTYDESSRYFRSEVSMVEAEPNETRLFIPASLTDAAYKIEGDAFSKDLCPAYRPTLSNIYTTPRIEAHAYVEVQPTDGTDKPKADSSGGLGDGSAPLTVRMAAIGNEPSAALFRWIIQTQGAKEGDFLLRYGGAECLYTFERAGRYVIRLEVTNRDGSCTDNSFSQEVMIRESMLDIPNAFSPHSSPGVNDVFRVKSKSLISFKASIFDRYGHLIYTWTDPEGGWNGRISGRDAPAGVYFYVITARGADGTKYNKRGDVNIIDAENREGQVPSSSDN